MAEHVSRTFVNAPCWLIVDLQMEGSSGSPGPADTQYFSISNLVVKAETAAPGGTTTNAAEMLRFP
jgi:hypothetical protein